MTNPLAEKIDRREVFRVVTAAAAAAGVASCAPSAAVPENATAKSKARYQPSSPDVQNFYRVNRYPTK